MALIWRIAIATVGAALVGLLGFFVLAWRPTIAPIEPPSRASFSQESIAKGAILSAAGHCAACHTGPGGQPASAFFPRDARYRRLTTRQYEAKDGSGTRYRTRDRSAANALARKSHKRHRPIQGGSVRRYPVLTSDQREPRNAALS
jgi:mono/diheme cytochrome c family protein